jgi:Domain of unknown function (DUF4214)
MRHHSLPSQGASGLLQLEALEERCVPSTADYVTGLYTTLLHRNPAPAEVAGWVDALNAGASAQDVALAFTGSAEYATNAIRSDYNLFLGRQPAPAETATWLQEIQAGADEKQVEAAFLTSDEFFSRHGGSASSWLTAVYHEVLGRSPDPAGLNVWSQALQAGSSRSDVALAIVDSPEADSRLVAAAYLDILRRNPDPSGLAVWVGELQQGLTPSELAAILASSDEFIGLTANGGLDASVVPPVEVVDPVAVPVLIDPFFDPFLGSPFLGGVTVAVDVGLGDGCGCDPWFADGGFGGAFGWGWLF